MKKKKLCIAIPASVVSDTPHLREKTAKIGLIGRASAIFTVNEIVVYPDNPKTNQKEDMDLIAALLNYMETPQYLRKRLFELKPQLQYAGILPPLRTPHHPLNRRMKNLKSGEYREGATLQNTKEGTLVDIGVEQPALVPNKQLVLGKRITVRIVKIEKRVEVEIADRDEISDYWGYRVIVERNPLGKSVKSKGFDLSIATSKYGVPFVNACGEIAEKWKTADSILVEFGAPARGLFDIAKDEGLNLSAIADFIVNTIPEQSTETVRTEEALIATLAILNVRFGL